MTTNIRVRYKGKGGHRRQGGESTGTNWTWEKVRRGARKRERTAASLADPQGTCAISREVQNQRKGKFAQSSHPPESQKNAPCPGGLYKSQASTILLIVCLTH